MAILAFAHAHEWEIYLATGIMGIGSAFAFAAMTALVVIAVPAEQTGVAAGMNTNIRAIGGSIGSAVMAGIVTSRLEPSGLLRESGYTTGFAVLAAALVVAALVALHIPSARRLGQVGPLSEAEAVSALTMSGDAVIAEAAAGKTVATELGD